MAGKRDFLPLTFDLSFFSPACFGRTTIVKGSYGITEIMEGEVGDGERKEEVSAVRGKER